MERQICIVALSVCSSFTLILSMWRTEEENWKSAYVALAISYVTMVVASLLNDFWKEED